MAKGAAVSGRPTFGGIKVLVEGVLHADDSGTIVRIGDQRAMGKKYAMKVVRREEPGDDLYVELARCHCEASQKLGHPALLKYHDFRLKRSWFKVVGAELLMEYVAGKSLDGLTGLGAGHLVQVFRQAAAGLAHMHRRDVRHGDLQPAHLLLSRSGEVKVLGYGLNLLSPGAREKFPFARAYLAPEQAKAKLVSDKADVYSLGAVMYHLLTGQSANVGRRAEGDLEKIPRPARLNPAIVGALDELLIGCLQSQPQRRPESMYAVSQVLDEVAKEMGTAELSLRGLAAGEAEG